MSVLMVIPARYASSRYPGKPLAMLRGADGVAKPLIRRAWEAAQAVAGVTRVVVATDAYIAKYSVRDMTSAGSSLKLCLVATGEADLYPRLGRTMEWDTAAGHAVLAGAGGEVVRFDDHSPLTYGKPGYENPFFIACAPGVDLQPA